jgi:tryptophanyl-tRNA synthetase
MRIFSGIQPTGALHIGNYLGMLKQSFELQKENDCIFCIVDLHAITIPYDQKLLPKNILGTAASYLSAGINPEKSILFVQSQIREHSELCWLLNTITPVGELFRMTQYKDKSKQFKKEINAGLLNYPLLQAADILLYKTDLVPVGKDQEQHIELSRTIARKFNQRFGKTFIEAETKTPKIGARIMALSDPKKKMSKSMPSGCLYLFDEPKIIRKKIMAATTDLGKEIKYDSKKKPGIANLLTIYSLFSETPINELEKKFKAANYAKFKQKLADLLVEKLEPLRKKQSELIKREVYVKEILEKGADKARTIARSTIKEVKEKMGLS